MCPRNKINRKAVAEEIGKDKVSRAYHRKREHPQVWLVQWLHNRLLRELVGLKR